MELREGQNSTVTATLKTASGNDAAYQAGTATWESSDPLTVSVEPSPDNELQAVIKGIDGSDNESVVITLRCDGDPDADQTREIIGTLDVVCTQGEAFVVALEASTPIDN